MRKVVKLKETDITNIVKRIISEQAPPSIEELIASGQLVPTPPCGSGDNTIWDNLQSPNAPGYSDLASVTAFCQQQCVTGEEEVCDCCNEFGVLDNSPETAEMSCDGASDAWGGLENFCSDACPAPYGERQSTSPLCNECCDINTQIMWDTMGTQAQEAVCNACFGPNAQNWVNNAYCQYCEGDAVSTTEPEVEEPTPEPEAEKPEDIKKPKSKTKATTKSKTKMKSKSKIKETKIIKLKERDVKNIVNKLISEQSPNTLCEPGPNCVEPELTTGITSYYGGLQGGATLGLRCPQGWVFQQWLNPWMTSDNNRIHGISRCVPDIGSPGDMAGHGSPDNPFVPGMGFEDQYIDQITGPGGPFGGKTPPPPIRESKKIIKK